MPWHTSDRAARLPPNWPQLRAKTKARAGGRCEWVQDDGTRCPAPGTDCDHRHRGDNHHPTNLQWLCTPHHKIKTAQENRDAQAKSDRLRRRPVDEHPGRIDP